MRKILIFFSLIFLIIFNISKVSAADIFIENFNGKFDSTFWTDYDDLTGHGTISFEEFPGSLTLRSLDIYFPFVHTTSQAKIFPLDGNFRTEVRFQYLKKDHEFGTGIVISNKLPTLGSPSNSSHSLFQVWQDGTNRLNYASSFAPRAGYSYDELSGGFYIIKKMPSTDTAAHTIKVEYLNDHYYYYVDSILIYETINTNIKPTNIWMGNPKPLTAASHWYDFSIDYIKISTLPTKMISMPHFSQTDSVWKDVEYDHSQQLGHNYTIGSSGCLISSASMILSRWGYTTDNASNITNPLNVNNFFKEHSGYDGNTNLFWSAIGHYASDAKKSVQAYTNLPNLELKIQKYNIDTVKADLDNDRPSILEIVQDDKGTGNHKDDDLHFVVARGYDNDHIYIHDPLNETVSEDSTLDGLYPEKTPRRMISFVPAYSDLSYLWMHLHTNQNAVVEFNNQKTGQDNTGNVFTEIPNAGYYGEGSIDGTTGKQVFELPKPAMGSYTLSVFGTAGESIKFDLNTYSKGSSVVSHTINSTIDADNRNDYILKFDPLNEDNNSALVKVADTTPDPEPDPDLFEELKNYIKQEFENRPIKTRVYRDLLLLKVELAQRLYERKLYRASEAMLDFIQKSLSRAHKNQVDRVTAIDINNKVEILRNSLDI